MRDEQQRRKKAAKVLRIIEHFLGRSDLAGLRLLDIGSSAGFIADECSAAGADVVGVDIDVPGLRSAAERSRRVDFAIADGSALPLRSESIDVCLYNHIYEHVLDPDAVMAEIQRVLRPDGIVYLALANRLGVIEPHYRLPFLSWLPPALASRYVHASGRGDAYHERLQTRRSLRRMVAGLQVWEYTVTVLASPVEFCAEDVVPSRLARLPTQAWRAALWVFPAYLWVGTKGARRPAGAATTSPPTRLSARSPRIS